MKIVSNELREEGVGYEEKRKCNVSDVWPDNFELVPHCRVGVSES